jgi:hypothetical protein
MKKLLLISSLFLLGCVAQTSFFKSGITREEFARDTYECEHDMRMASGSFQRPRQPDSTTGYHIVGKTVQPYEQPDAGAAMHNLGATLGEIADRRAFVERCMGARGYVVVTLNSQPDQRYIFDTIPEGTTYRKWRESSDGCLVKVRDWNNIPALNGCLEEAGFKNARAVTEAEAEQWKKQRFADYEP